MRRLLVFGLLLALLPVGTALASHLDPQKKIRPADQARARAMLFKKADFGSGVRTQPNAADAHVTCRGVSQSDLTVTGEAESPTFIGGVTAFSSSAQVYRTLADSNGGWRRSTGAGAAKCLELVLSREYSKQGLTLQSFRKRAFPRVGHGSVAFRVVLSGESQGVTVSFTLDVIGLLYSRAQVALAVVSLSPPTKPEEVRLARIVAGRMAKAMGGS
ncbi:MAG: hypothetical protein ACRDPV_13110 [Gaiellaceae bacterium]